MHMILLALIIETIPAAEYLHKFNGTSCVSSTSLMSTGNKILKIDISTVNRKVKVSLPTA